MALFSRKKNEDALVKRIAEEVIKASGNNMGMTPYGGTGYATTSAAMPSQMMQSPGSGGQGLLQSPGTQANPLPRFSYDFGAQLGPSAPFLPAPLDPVFDDSGRALPRLWEYPVAWNLDLNMQSTPWTVLRSMADQIDIIHRCIEIKISEITKMEWSFDVEDATIFQMMSEQNVSHAKAAKIARELYDEKIVELRKFWENPYPTLGRTFTEWMTEFLWQHFVFDGTPVYPRYNLGKNVIGFEIIDAPTIKVLLDNRGAVPAPPAPAYQQILWGFPRGEYQSSPESDGEFFSGEGKAGEYMRDQLAYFVRNRRTWSPYGFSCVEEAVPSATIYLERQMWMKSEYSNGSAPMAFFETDSDEMEPTRLAAWERVFNDKMSGQTGERHKMKVLPRGFKPTFAPTIDERYKTDYDNFLILRIATIFGVSPSTLGIIPRSGLGGAGEREGEAQQALTTSQKPLESFLVETINTLSRRFLGADKNITFHFDDDNDNIATLNAKSTAYQTSLYSGQMTMNDVRGELGMPLYDMPEADEPFILGAGGSPVFLKGLLEVNESGETVEQKGTEATDDEMDSGAGSSGNVSEESKDAEGSKGKGSQGKDSEGKGSQNVGESKASSSDVDDAEKSVSREEIREFSRFVKSRHKNGKWRAFDFVTIPEEVADKLNEQGYFIVKGVTPMPESVYDWAASYLNSEITDTPKGLLTKRALSDVPGIKHKLMVEKHYAPIIEQALANSITGVEAAIKQAMESSNKAADDDLSAARLAVAQNIKVDTLPLQKSLEQMALDSGFVGSAYAVREMGDGASLVSDLSKASVNFDWDSWEPGNPLAASMITEGRMLNVLNGTKATANGIGKTTTKRITNAIVNGISAGDPAKSIAKDINAIIQDPQRAMTIAVTETNYAYNSAAVDQYAASGLTQFEWFAYDDGLTCEVCLDEESANPHDLSDDVPPAHPNCRCTVLAVISSN